MKILKYILACLLILASAYLAIEIKAIDQKRAKLIHDYNELHHVKYGLLSVHQWKEKVSDIIAQKVRNFQLTSENREALSQKISDALYALINEIKLLVEENRRDQNMFMAAITFLVDKIFFSINDLEKKVPYFTELILDGLDNYDSREKLRSFIQSKIDELLEETVGYEDLSAVSDILDRYQQADVTQCSQFLDNKINTYTAQMEFYALCILALMVSLFLIVILSSSLLSVTDYALLLSNCTVLLFIGLTTPMIEIDARIEHFQFLLMGEAIAFNNQILFAQSKSILDVILVLVQSDAIQSITVGIFIFAFSFLFPITKILASIVLLNRASTSSSKFIQFLVLYTGKWSMADVFVVAIFMAYIGFTGILQKQLSSLENISDKVEVLTLDHSRFGIGFGMFMAFCIGSLIISSLLHSRLNPKVHV